MMAAHFSEVTAMVRTNYIGEFAQFLPLPQLDRFSTASKIDRNGIPKNVQVFPTPTCYVPTDRGYKKLGNRHLSSVEALIRKKEINFDLIHAHFTWTSGYVGAKLKERYEVPFVVTAHGYDIYSLPFKDTSWRKNIEYVLNTADVIVTVSQSNVKYINRLDVETPVRVIPNGFKCDSFFPRKTSDCRRVLDLPQDRKILLTVGNLEPVKGQRYLVEAIAEITRKRKDIFCVIVGMGGEKKALEKQIRSAHLDKFILLAGGKPHNEIPVWMNACDLFILPSLNEGNPTVMFEALGCGKPFIGTNVGGVPEVITSEEYGLLVAPSDVGDLVKKILVALDRDWDREKIIEYSKNYMWERVVIEIMNVYSQVSGESRWRAP